MKKNFLLAAALLTVASLMATDYDLYVGGKQVTSSNAADVLNDGGKVKYDASTKTLTLNNVTIMGSAYTDNNAITSDIDNLTVVVKGSNTLIPVSDSPAGLVARGNCTVVSGESNSVLNIRAESANSMYAAVYFTEKFTISGGSYGLTLNIAGPARYGIIHGTSTKSNLTVNNAAVNMTNVEKSVVQDVDELTLTGCAAYEPEGVRFDNSMKAVVDANGQVVVGNFAIKTVKNYPIMFYLDNGDFCPNDDNLNDVLGDGGSVSYDPKTDLLTFNNLTLKSSKTDIISAWSPVHICLKGDNTIEHTAKNGNALNIEGDIYFSGDGDLEINTSGNGIYADGGVHFSPGCSVSVYADKCGIISLQYGAKQESDWLSVDSAWLAVWGWEEALRGVEKLSMNNCIIASYTSYSSADRKFYEWKTKNVAHLVVIGPWEEYEDIRIMDKPVNKWNEDDILYNGCNLRYIDETKTLRFENATFDSPLNHDVIFSKVDDLTIEVYGQNTITARSDGELNTGIFSSENCTLVGKTDDASLTICGADPAAASVRVGINAFKTFTIDNLNLEINGISMYGLWGGMALETSFVIRNSNVDLVPFGEFAEGAVVTVPSLILEGCEITAPVDAHHDDNVRALVNAEGRRIRSEVKIQRTATALESLSAPASGTAKQLIDGRLVILRDGIRYNAQGQIVE